MIKRQLKGLLTQMTLKKCYVAVVIFSVDMHSENKSNK